MHLWFIWWGRGHGGCYLVWDDGHWGSWVGCVGFVWRWFLEAGSEIDHDLLTSFGTPIQPRQDCIFRSCSFIQKEVLNAPDLFSRCSAKIQAMAERGRAPVGGGGGANISQHTAMSNLTWPLTLSTLMIWMIELSTNWWIKMILWPTTKRLYNSIRFGDAVAKTRNPCWGCPYYGSRRAVAEAKRMGFCWKLLQFNPLISWRSCTNDKESQTVGLVNLLLFWWNHVFIYVSQRHVRVLTCWLSHLLWEDDFRSYYRWY